MDGETFPPIDILIDMAGIIPYVVWGALIIGGLSLLCMVLFGIRGIVWGKMNYTTMALLGGPFLLLVVLGFTMDTWAEAAVMTFLILLVLTSLSLLLSSARGLLGF